MTVDEAGLWFNGLILNCYSTRSPKVLKDLIGICLFSAHFLKCHPEASDKCGKYSLL